MSSEDSVKLTHPSVHQFRLMFRVQNDRTNFDPKCIMFLCITLYVQVCIAKNSEKSPKGRFSPVFLKGLLRDLCSVYLVIQKCLS